MTRFSLVATMALALIAPLPAAEPAPQWKNGPPSDPNFFPIAVWLQSPANAERYRKAGINTYVALWKGPDAEQLATLKKAGMWLICDQNEFAKQHLDDPTIIGWMHGDEPDNAQPLPGGKGYGPPITPEKIQADYARIRAVDPSRPIMLNLGQGVAYDNYIGRGVRRGHLEDYPEYIKGGDIVSFDIYPAVHETSVITGQLWYVAKGVERLVRWSNRQRFVWNCLECTHIGNPNRKATPQEVRAEAWMSIIHGSRGLIWFVHEFKPKFREAALLDDAPMLEAVTAINHQITELAPMINSPSIRNDVSATTGDEQAPVASMTRCHDGKTYVFAVGMRGKDARATFTVPGLTDGSKVEVIGENRTLESKASAFSDAFAPWDVHLYRFPETK